jgi:hypothetical protein
MDGLIGMRRRRFILTFLEVGLVCWLVFGGGKGREMG